MFNKMFFPRLVIYTVIAVSIMSFMNLPNSRLFADEQHWVTAEDYQSVPPFVTAGVPPLLMLVMGRDHKLYYEAYNDASDLNGDGKLDVGYNPNKIGTAPTKTSPASADYRPAIDYYGYFDSHKYYTYSGSRFEPAGPAPDKRVPASVMDSGNTSYWSGDFLNYLTMTRMDCLRKVLYGGYRSTDTATETVLQRVYVPQDAHSWGKEYQSVARDGYNINEYAPLPLPDTGKYHLFASTTLSDNGDPVLRVLPNNTHRIWEWVAKERPVCDDSLVSSGGVYTSHPNNNTEYNSMMAQFATAAHLQGSSANNIIDSDHDNLTLEKPGDSNPYDGNDSNYMSVFTGSINIITSDTYQFAVDGDDAVELIIDGNVVAGWYGDHGKCNCNTHTGSIYLTAGNHNLEFRHEEGSGDDNYYLRWNQGNTVNIWQIVPAARYSSLTQTFYGLELSASTITDYIVRVKVCDATKGLEPNSQRYPLDISKTISGYKPVGILQKYGELNRMLFGLITGSYMNNLSGGVLRKNIGSITDEIDLNTGIFKFKSTTEPQGIINTINNLRITGFRYTDHTYQPDCGWITDGPLDATKSGSVRTPSKCEMWGNPIAEIMYSGLMHFSGTPENGDDDVAFLPKPSWRDPYSNTAEDTNGNGTLDTWEDINKNRVKDGFGNCAKPFMLVLSDINPSFDSDSTLFGSIPVITIADNISTVEEGGAQNHFIGKSGTIDNGACTPKEVTGFGDITGLCPEEPTKKGGYYSPSVAYYGNVNDINSAATDDQKIGTYCIALASPIPTIDIKVGEVTSGVPKIITLVPFGKSVGPPSSCYNISTNTTIGYQPTNTIVDFFVDKEYGISDTKGKFRINYEDVEQGADHDMDAIVEYTYQVVDASGNAVTDYKLGKKVKISLKSIYAAGCIIQHMGYIISGTTQDGTYLEVMDKNESVDYDYCFDTPPGIYPNTTGECNTGYNDGQKLPLESERTFEPGTSNATFLKNPLWYAAKWGGFNDYNGNQIPDLKNEWDADNDETPDTYFYVQNPLKLEQQLNKAFADILKRTASGTAASVISQSKSGEGAVYQAVFYPGYIDKLGNTVNWAGDVHALFTDSYGNMREDTWDKGTDDKYIRGSGNKTLDVKTVSGDNSTPDRIIIFDNGVVKKYKTEVDGLFNPAGQTPEFTGTIEDVHFLWSATDWLNRDDLDVLNQRAWDTATTSATERLKRYIFTSVGGTTKIPFIYTATASFLQYMNIFPTAKTVPASTYYSGTAPTFTYDGLSKLMKDFKATAVFDDYITNQSQRIIKYIRGQDQPLSTITKDSHTYILPAFRTRQADLDGDGVVNTWRLGDIVYSTPTVVGKPAENYHLLYKDASYGKFLADNKNRRQVVYAGANDGMLHAFNGGFFDTETNSFLTTGSNDEAAYDLGAELWAYIPYNLLPHLYWLTEPSYPHVYYCDLQPKVFDAKILPDSDSDGELEWGTFLVAGMRLGGGAIKADENKDGIQDDDEPVMKSAYFIFDITDPESEPKLIAEFSLDKMGYTTSNPTVVPVNVTNSLNKTAPEAKNNWYLVFGSGPADADGLPAPVDTVKPGIESAAAIAAGTIKPGSKALTDVVSEQKGKVFVVNLKNLVQNKTLDAADVLTYSLDSDAENSFVSDPVTVDANMDFSADVVYFGTVGGNNTDGWNGKLRRIAIDNLNRSDANNDPTDTTKWKGDSVLLATPGQAITTDPNAAIDDRGRLWAYFGTGRYYIKSRDLTISGQPSGSLSIAGDETITDQQTYYGIIEPFNDHGSVGTDNKYMDSDENFTWGTVSKSDLLDVTRVKVQNDKSISGITVPDSNSNGSADWDDLVVEIDKFTTTGGGWRMDFTLPPNYTVNSERERNLSQAALFGELLTFTTYIPGAESNTCEVTGDSNLYAVYYKTGTAYYEPAIGYEYLDTNGNGTIDSGETTVDSITKMLPLGTGLAGTPNIHAGKQEGSTAYIQTSTGDIITINQINPEKKGSSILTWKEGNTECN
ncbi:MAG: PilC/PilY family type IV pilus protein [Desulfamplus sp.]